MELPLTTNDIQKVLPHRYPFLLVDRITELELGKRVKGIKCVTINEPFFQGHFPGEPVMPGVLIIEGMAQTGGVLARLTVMGSREIDTEAATYFMGIDKVKFRRPVIPGDQLVYEVRALRTGSKVWKVQAEARVGDETAAQAELMAMVG